MTYKEDMYTSTGVKFWRHTEQMMSYRQSTGHTVVSTHISPEGRCNLKCSYCSVANRKTTATIDLDCIKDYVEKLQTRGLKAVILTGGGEPTVYNKFNDLVKWLKIDRGLSTALITNGTLSSRIDRDVWPMFSWIRVSVNRFDGFKTRISLPVGKLSDECVVGCSYVCSTVEDIDSLKDVSLVASNINAKYVRVLPNCLVDESSLMSMHSKIDIGLSLLDDERFFRQNKVYRPPNESICHQSYFRPYLSEAHWRESGIPGSVYPCDSVVLNDSRAIFDEKYQLCRPEDILEFLDMRLKQGFNPTDDCKNCVFFKNVEMLGSWKRGNPCDPIVIHRIDHEEFV